MRALSIRQHGLFKLGRVEESGGSRRWSCGRDRLTIIGERFYIYAAKVRAKTPIWSDDLRVATPPPPLWMIELAEQVKLIEPGTLLPTDPQPMWFKPF
jgi:hypothetical protein